MTVKDDKTRKLITFDKDVWAEIEEIRWNNRLKSESEAVRYVVNAGLSALKASRAKVKKPS